MTATHLFRALRRLFDQSGNLPGVRSVHRVVARRSLMVCDFARLVMKRSRSGLIIRSCWRPP